MRYLYLMLPFSSRKSVEYLWVDIIAYLLAFFVCGCSLEVVCLYHWICQQKHQFMWMLSNMTPLCVDAVPVQKQREKIGWSKPERYLAHLKLLIEHLNCHLWLMLYHHAMQQIFCCPSSIYVSQLSPWVMLSNLELFTFKQNLELLNELLNCHIWLNDAISPCHASYLLLVLHLMVQPYLHESSRISNYDL